MLPSFCLDSEKAGTSLVAQMVKNACSAGNQASIPGLGRSPGEGNDNPLQYSHWRIPWRSVAATVRGVTELDTTE